MSTVSLQDARRDLDGLFRRVLGGETIVIQEEAGRVALHAFVPSDAPELAPPGYFAKDYSPSEIAELNQLAAHAPTSLVP